MSATATSCSTKTTVNTTARSVTFATAGAMEMCFHVVKSEGVTDGVLTDCFEDVERGLRVWFTLRELKSIVLEFLDAAGKVVRAFEFPIIYDLSPSSDEHFEVKVNELREALASLPNCGAKKYELLVTFTTNDHMPVRGWSKCKRRDVKDLKKVKLGENMVSTTAIKLDAFVFLGE